MTTIVNKYVGITHPLGDDIINHDEISEAWRLANCKQGIHAFDEVWSLDSHYLHCDICGMEVHIDHIVIPDGKDDVVGEKRKVAWQNGNAAPC